LKAAGREKYFFLKIYTHIFNGIQGVKASSHRIGRSLKKGTGQDKDKEPCFDSQVLSTE
jgi:hypothetical protein